MKVEVKQGHKAAWMIQCGIYFATFTPPFNHLQEWYLQATFIYSGDTVYIYMCVCVYVCVWHSRIGCVYFLVALLLTLSVTCIDQDREKMREKVKVYADQRYASLIRGWWIKCHTRRNSGSDRFFSLIFSFLFRTKSTCVFFILVTFYFQLLILCPKWLLSLATFNSVFIGVTLALEPSVSHASKFFLFLSLLVLFMFSSYKTSFRPIYTWLNT